jgi:hypothetical protein
MAEGSTVLFTEFFRILYKQKERCIDEDEPRASDSRRIAAKIYEIIKEGLEIAYGGRYFTLFCRDL